MFGCFITAGYANPTGQTDWNKPNHVDLTAHPLDDNTIFFQEAGHTIDTIGTLHAHITIDIQRPLLQLQRVNHTIHNGIKAVHNQLITFLHIIKKHDKYDAFNDHLPSQRIQDQTQLRQYLLTADYDGLLQDVRLITRFATATYNFASTHPPIPIDDNELLQAYHTPTEDPFQPTHARLTRSFPVLMTELQQWMDMERDVELHAQHLSPFTPPHSRPKRFISMLIAGAAVLASTFLGTWNTVEIQHLKSSNHDLVVQVHDMVKQQVADDEHLTLIDRVINTIQQDTQQLQQDLVYQQFIDHTRRQLQIVQSEITQINQILDGLMQHRLSSSAIDHDMIFTMFTNISHTASNLNYQILPADTFQLLQCPTSFIAQDNHVHIFLHIPITHPNANKLSIYKHIPLPFHIHQQPAIITRPTKQYIAINSLQQTFFTMDQAQFQACTPVGKLFVCHNQIVHNHPNTQSITNATIPREDACLFALFLQKADTAAQICDVFPAHLDPPQLIQVHNDQVLIHTFVPTVSVTTCPGGEHSDLHVTKPTLVTIPPSCTLSIPSSAFTATINLDRSFQHKIYTWPHDPILFLTPLQSTFAIQSLQSRLPYLHPNTNLKLWAQHNDHDNYLYIWNFGNSLMIIIVTIGILCYLARISLQVARYTPTYMPPIPSAPPPSPRFRAYK